jgi:hypothetical protein
LAQDNQSRRLAAPLWRSMVGSSRTSVVRAFVGDSLLVKTFSGFGMIEVESENDPKQSRRTDGVWTFDPRNRVYAKTFHLVWLELVDDRNDVSLGNIIEAILGFVVCLNITHIKTTYHTQKHTNHAERKFLSPA